MGGGIENYTFENYHCSSAQPLFQPSPEHSVQGLSRLLKHKMNTGESLSLHWSAIPALQVTVESLTIIILSDRLNIMVLYGCPSSTAPTANLYLLYLPFWPIPVSFPADTNRGPGAPSIPDGFPFIFCCSSYSLCLTPLSPSYDHVMYQQLTHVPVSHSLLDPFN